MSSKGKTRGPRKLTQAAFDKFCINNSDIIDQYENATNNNIQEESDDIISIINERLVPGNTSISYLSDALREAIDTETDIIDVLSTIGIPEKKQKIDSTHAISSFDAYVKDLHRHRNELMKDPDYENNKEYQILNAALGTVNTIRRYTASGVDVLQLISAANDGILYAWEKFDPNRTKVKSTIENKINENNPQTVDDYTNIIFNAITYGDLKDNLTIQWDQDKLTFPSDPEQLRATVKVWMDKYIPKAKFFSVAQIWARAYIKKEIMSRTVVKDPSYTLQQLNIDDNIKTSRNDEVTIGDSLESDITTDGNIESDDNLKTFQHNLHRLMNNIPARARTILFRRFGIGLPRPLTTSEIASQDNLTDSRVVQILAAAIETMKQNAAKLGITGQEMHNLIANSIN